MRVLLCLGALSAGACRPPQLPEEITPQTTSTMPDVRAPSPGSAASDAGARRPDEIRDVVVAHRGALMACYELEAAKEDSTHGGAVTVRWRIAAEGSVTAVDVVDSTFHNGRVEGCIVRQVRSWHFPPSSDPSEVKFPFAFGAH
jgi:hypothetical protein